MMLETAFPASRDPRDSRDRGSEGAKSRCDIAFGAKKEGGSRQPPPAQRLCLHALALPHLEPSHPVVSRAMRASDRVASPRHSPTCTVGG